LKLARPDWSVIVHERAQGSGDTFGFGVVLTESTMNNLTQADPESAAEIRAVSHSGHALRLIRGRERIDLHGPRNLAVARSSLLEVLTGHALAAGVVVNTGQEVDGVALDADVVIAADGVRSAIREKFATELGVEIGTGRSRYLWCGADFALQDSIFAPVRTHDGLFVAHAYPYAQDRSTFLIETDDATWESAGMRASERATPPARSDEYSLRYMQDAFAEYLEGHRLLGNRSRWLRFSTVHLRRWSHENVVLIGDAAHTAHYTLGSGTKLAMEDAIALSNALLTEPDVPTAFARYEESRRPSVEAFQRLAERSQRWWESFRLRLDQPVTTLALGFLTRAGNIDLETLGEHSDRPLLGAL
ncbi:MAG: FAD-dependent monooxygenase, partial [Mycobacterium sp.]